MILGCLTKNETALSCTLDSSSRQCGAGCLLKISVYICPYMDGCKGNCSYGISSPWSRLNFM